ncbi:hypothetical protein BN1221_00710 [Brenneria goodwinii]|uniref:Uncharacterized protein n=1 Tax=Brenneria goodwinii TaxID=1109412 RepID=A0A0G4JQY6_9GAMM|nr:hypothetical protein BN1221_00710 [Brenneria goodwinii]
MLYIQHIFSDEIVLFLCTFLVLDYCAVLGKTHFNYLF